MTESVCIGKLVSHGREYFHGSLLYYFRWLHLPGIIGWHSVKQAYLAPPMSRYN